VTYLLHQKNYCKLSRNRGVGVYLINPEKPHEHKSKNSKHGSHQEKSVKDKESAAIKTVELSPTESI
jgi:uncharacterized cupredoxin-like copper-binding protein